MERQGCRDAKGVPELRTVTLGQTTIGDQVTSDLLAYVVRATATVYVDDADLARVAKALRATVSGKLMTITQRGRRGFVLACDIAPFEDLPKDEPAKIGDGKVVADHVCTLVEPGSCCHMMKEPFVLDFSFKAPDYGMSWCQVAANETCASWLHAETCVTFFGFLCQPPPGFAREITAWVCSIE
jgi:hypothetical protein